MAASQPYPPELRAYLGFMREIKHRHQQISAVFSGEHGLTRQFVHDLGWLQLRLMCETLALACLVVHEAIPVSRTLKMQREYKANVILKKLEELHPSYFPKPMVEQPDSDYPGVMRVSDKEDGFLSKRELVKLYGVPGEHLHRGSLDDIAQKKRAFPFDAKTVTRPLGKIAELLELHTIQPIDPSWVYLVRMANSRNQVELKGYQRTPDGGSVDLVRVVQP
jgi:hypothetical protein